MAGRTGNSRKPTAKKKIDTPPRRVGSVTRRGRSRTPDPGAEGSARHGPTPPPDVPCDPEDSDPLCPAFDEIDDELDYQRVKMAWNMSKIRKRELVNEGAPIEEINRLRRAYKNGDDDTFMNLRRPPPARAIGMGKIRAAEAEKIEAQKAIEAAKEFERAEAERRRLALETAYAHGDGRPRLGGQEAEPASSSTGAGVLDDGYAAPHGDESPKKKPKPFEKTFGDAQTLDSSLSTEAGVSQSRRALGLRRSLTSR